MKKAVEAFYRYSAKYDIAMFLTPIDVILQQFLTLTPQTYVLGDEGGICFLYPLHPGWYGNAHIYIWDHDYFQRPSLLRSMVKDALSRWELKRIGTQIPSRHRLATKTAEDVGFTKEGVLRQAVLYNKGVDDLFVYGVLPGEV